MTTTASTTTGSTPLTPVISRYWDDPESWTLQTYLRHDGYQGLQKALSMEPDAVIGMVKDSGLRGRGGAGFSTMQATLVYLAAPPEMRSRILGVLSVCIGTGPIGFVWLGLLADTIGAHWATAATGAIGLLAMALTRKLWRAI